jgi:hypothetical protein
MDHSLLCLTCTVTIHGRIIIQVCDPSKDNFFFLKGEEKLYVSARSCNHHQAEHEENKKENIPYFLSLTMANLPRRNM